MTIDYNETLHAHQERLCALIDQCRKSRELAVAIQKNDIAAVRLHLKEGADPNTFANVRWRAPALHFAVTDYCDYDPSEFEAWEQVCVDTYYNRARVDNREMMAALLDAGADIDGRDGNGTTPLRIAVQISTPDIIQFLLERGADVHVRYKDDTVVLHYAVSARQPDIVRMLLDAGADLNARDRVGKTPLLRAMNSRRNAHYTRHEDIEGNMEVVLEAGADVDVHDIHGMTVEDYLPHGLRALLWANPWERKMRKRLGPSSRRSGR